MSENDSSILLAIDQGRFSIAQSELSRKLKKFPNRSYYWAVHCYLLARQGKLDQAAEQSTNLKAKVPNDPQALELLHKVFMILGRPKDAQAVYENAVKKYPSGDLIEAWFQMAGANLELRTMQKAAMALQKHKKSDPKLAFRAAFCCLHLALSPIANLSEKEASSFLSQGLKLLEGHNFTSALTQEMFVYCKLLTESKQFDELTKLVEVYTKPIDLDLQLLHLNALDQLENWTGLLSQTKRLLFEEKFNDFDTWKYYIKAAKNSGQTYTECARTISLHTPETRNSQLATIEAAKVFSESYDALLVSYFEKFSSKLCCYADLMCYRGANFVDVVKERAQDIIESNDITTSNVITLVNCQKLIQEWETALDEEAFTATNWAIYHKFKPLLAEKVETDAYPANELILMNVSLELGKGSPESVVKSIIVLESLLDCDPEDFKVRLLLLHLYGRAGCNSLAIHNYKKLGIKMFQHESLGHLIVDFLTPNKANLTDLVNIFRFYLTAGDGLADSVLLGFKDNVYNKLDSFLLFSARLNESLSRHLVLLQIVKFARVLGDHQYTVYFSKVLREHENDILDSSLVVRDNRDYTTLWAFGTSSKPIGKAIRRGSEFVQLGMVKEMLILEADPTKSTKLMKQLNKLVSSEKLNMQMTTYEQWVLKLEVTLLKLFRQPASKETDALVNFMVKNLKLDKIRLMADGTSTNHFIFEILDLIKIYAHFDKTTSFKNALLHKVFAGLAVELKAAQLTGPAIADISGTTVDAVPATFSSEIVEMVQKSLNEASYTNCI